MIQTGDVFMPVSESANDATQAVYVDGPPHGTTRMVPCHSYPASGGRVSFDVVESSLLDPLKWRLQSYVGTRYAPPPSARKLGDGLREIADMIDEREKLYGPALASWDRIAAVVGITRDQALGVLLAMKRERALFSPENPDHVRDQIGYLAILAEAKRA